MMKNEIVTPLAVGSIAWLGLTMNEGWAVWQRILAFGVCAMVSS